MKAHPGGPRGRGRGGDKAGGRGGGKPGGRSCAEAGGGPYRRSVLEVATLAIIAESTTHGYELVEQIDALAGSLVCIDPGSMYRLLRGMEQQGLVTSTWQTPEAGPSRRVYEITETGIEALGVMAESLDQRATAMEKLATHARRAAEAAGPTK